MVDRLKISELDFDTIKNNLKLFLKQQNEFTDYDFEGSGLNILLDILAYNTHYQAYYLNMIANESFLDTALLRDSVVSHAKTLGYIPYSKKAAMATINFEVRSTNSSDGELNIPRGFSFLSNQIDGKSYNYIVLEDISVTKSNTSYVFENLQIYEGQLNHYSFVHEQLTNPNQIFTLPDDNIDTTTLKVIVSPSTQSTNITVYSKADDITNSDQTSEIYFIQEHRNGKYQIYFGNGIVGKSLPDGAVVHVNYLATNGTASNKANNFIATLPLTDSLNESLTNFVITPVNAAAGGADRESGDEIKYKTPLQFLSQNRLITVKDYEVFIRSAYPSIDSVSVWGGEDEDPPIYGKIFVSLKPKEGFYLSETEKQNIIDNVISPKSILTIKTEFRDPEFLYLIIKSNVKYDKQKTVLTEKVLQSSIRNAILSYKNLYLDKFGSTFVISKMQETIDSVDRVSIVGSDSIIRVEKRIQPVLNKVSNYSINFNVPLLQGTPFNKLTSSEFRVNDYNGIERTVFMEEVPKSFTGVNSVEIVDPGTNYTSTPTVTITGDGFGATAEAIVSLGKIQKINITNPGIDYNQATITISGGGGFGATAVAVIDSRVGKLRAVYYTSNSERIVVYPDIGEINYDTGILTLTDLNIIGINTTDGLIRVQSGVRSNFIESNKNTILTIDEQDTSSITVTMQHD